MSGEPTTKAQAITAAVAAANKARAASVEAGRQVTAEREAREAADRAGQGTPDIPPNR